MSDTTLPTVWIVLGDTTTFAGADGCNIIIGPQEDKWDDETYNAAENGVLPDVTQDWPFISLSFTIHGDLVAKYHGFPGNRDNTSIVLADGDLLRRMA